MISRTVYKVFNRHIGLSLKDVGYKKAKSSMLGYCKKVNELYVNFWVQCSRDGFDAYAGSKFVVQFSVEKVPEVGFSGLDGGRIRKYLSGREAEEIRVIQNNIIQRLTPPDRDYFPPATPTNVVDWYFRQFEPNSESYSNTHDIWFRFKTEIDVEEWAKYLAKIIVRTLSSLEMKYQEI